MSKQRFQLGQLVGTPGATAFLTADESRTLIERHQSGDWGDIGEHDKRVNDEASAHETDACRRERLLSAYTVRNRRIWIITEHDRSVTTILFPEEY